MIGQCNLAFPVQIPTSDGRRSWFYVHTARRETGAVDQSKRRSSLNTFSWGPYDSPRVRFQWYWPILTVRQKIGTIVSIDIDHNNSNRNRYSTHQIRTNRRRHCYPSWNHHRLVRLEGWYRFSRSDLKYQLASSKPHSSNHPQSVITSNSQWFHSSLLAFLFSIGLHDGAFVLVVSFYDARYEYIVPGRWLVVFVLLDVSIHHSHISISNTWDHWVTPTIRHSQNQLPNSIASFRNVFVFV